nr:glutathione S-transferase [uncultured Sphingorhabdus sp.]
MTDLPILYSFRRCPYAMRARMAVAVSGVEVELREVVLRDKPAEMLESSPKGTVPVLVLNDGTVIDESLDVMHWALARHDPLSWLAHVDAERIAANDGPFKHALDRYKYPHRYDLADGLEHRALGLAHLTDLENALSSAPFLLGEQPGFTDIALFPFVRQFAATDTAWFDALPLPKVQAWLESLTGSALFAQIMGRYPQWKAGDAITIFP